MGQVAHGGHGEDGPVVAHQVELAHVQAGLLPRRPHVARGHVLGHVLSACHDALHLTGHAPAQRAADCFTQLQFAVHSRASNEPSRRFVLNVKAIVGTFNQEKALAGAFSVILKSSRTFV